MPTKMKKKKGDRETKAADGKAKNFQDLADNFDDVETDFNKLVHHEYMRLHRQYRLLEDSNSALQGQKQSLIRQRNLVQLAMAEKLNLEIDLWNVTAEHWKEDDIRAKRTILNILEDFNKKLNGIKQCVKDVEDMEKNVDKTDKRLLDHRVKVLAIYGSSMSAAQIEKRKNVLENRLHHVSSQLSLKMTENKAIKDEISQMLVLRELYYNRLMEIKRETNKIKSRMGAILYLATGAYDQRDTYITKVKYLRDKNESDSKAHVTEIKELNRAIHYDTKLYGFLTTKCKHRNVILTDTERMYRHEMRQIKTADEILAQYHRSFEQILKISKSENFRTLLSVYRKTEQVNFALYKYTTDLNHEVKSLQADMIRCGLQIGQVNEDLLNYKEQKKEELKAKWAAIEERRENYKIVKTQLENSESKLKELNEHLVNLFDLIGIDSIMFLRGQTGKGAGTGSNDAVLTKRNVKANLRVFESRISELLSRKQQLEAKQLAFESGGGGGFPRHERHLADALFSTGIKFSDNEKSSGGPFLPSIEVTGISGVEEEDHKDMLERPIYYDEMKIHIFENIAIAQAQASKHPLTDDPMTSSYALLTGIK